MLQQQVLPGMEHVVDDCLRIEKAALIERIRSYGAWGKVVLIGNGRGGKVVDPDKELLEGAVSHLMAHPHLWKISKGGDSLWTNIPSRPTITSGGVILSDRDRIIVGAKK